MQPATQPSLLGLVGRVFWMLLGPLLLGVTTYMIIRTGNGWLTIADLAFLGLLAGMMLGRWLEFRGGNPQTAEGEPAGPHHLRRYLIAVLMIGLAIWVIANIVANYLLQH
jgi:hypothetical protein